MSQQDARPSETQQDASHGTWLTRDQFLGLARRCWLPVDRELLTALAREGLLPMVQTDQGRRYAPAHLWLLHLYLDAVRLWRHPWQAEPSGGQPPEALARVREGARDLNAALAWWLVRQQTSTAAPDVALQIARQLSQFAQEVSPLGPLRQLIPLLNGAARAGMRGDALLAELVEDQARRVLEWRPDSAPAPAPASEAEPVEQRATMPLPTAPSQEAAADQGADPEATQLLDTRETLSVDVDLQAAAAPREPEADGPALARAAEAASSGVRRARDGQVDKFAGPVPITQGGLKEALARARAAAQRRMRDSHKDSLPEQEARREPELPEADHEAAEAAREDTSAPPPSASQANVSLEEQVRELNQRRQEYIRQRQWDKLVQLYTDRIYLFPRASERRQIFSNVGAIYEQKLKQPERAMEAWRQAFEADPGDRTAYNALRRLYHRAERWEELLSVIDWMIELHEGSPEQMEFQIHRARLLGTHLGQSDQALLICRDLLTQEMNEETRQKALEALQRIARDGQTDGEVLLSVATLLEAHWSVETHAERLIDLYERLFDVLADRDPTHAAESMSRLAATYQANGRYQDAFVALGRALSSKPEREDLHGRLEALAKRLDQLHELASLYEEEAARALGQSQRLALLRRLASLYEKLGDAEGLRQTWMTIADADPFDLDALRTLARLHMEADQWEDLLETLGLLREQLQGPDRVQLLMQIAQLRTEGLRNPSATEAALNDVDAAFTALQDALAEVDYGTPAAQSILDFVKELMGYSQPALAFQLAELLEPFLASHDAHAEIVNLYERLISVHLESAEGTAEAARLLLRVGQLHQGRLRQPRKAWLYYSKALRLNPREETTLEHLMGLTERLGQWEECAALLEDILDGEAPSPRAPWLRRIARIYDRQLHQEEQALPWYEALLNAQPGDNEALDFLEDYAQEHQRWHQLVEVLEARANTEGAVAARKELLARSAALCLEHLGDERRALTLLRQALTVDPNDEHLLQRLLALYQGQGDWEAVEEFLARQQELALDPQVQGTLLMERTRLLVERLGRPQEALPLLARLEQLRPEDPELLRLKGQVLAQAGDPEDAATALRQRIALLQRGGDQDAMVEPLEQLVALYQDHPPEPALQIQAGELLLSRKPDHLGALGLLERAYEDQGRWRDLCRALYHHARLMQRRGEPAAAGVLYERILEVSRSHQQDTRIELEALSQLSQLQPQPDQGQLERRMELSRKLEDWKAWLQANEEFIQLLEDREDRVEVLLEMAQVARAHLEDSAFALGYLERAYDAQPRDRRVLEGMAGLLRQRRQYGRLADVLRAQLELEGGVTPSQTVALRRELAEILERHLSAAPEAVQVLDEALVSIDRYGEVISPELQQQVRRRLANLHQRLGQEDQSLDQLQELQRSMVDNDDSAESVARICEEMGQLALGLGRLEEAEQHYLNAIAENANFAEAQLGLASVYIKGKRWDRALEVLEPLSREVNTIESAVERGRVFSSMGTAYQAQGQLARARQAFEAALQQDPRNGPARDALA